MGTETENTITYLSLVGLSKYNDLINEKFIKLVEAKAEASHTHPLEDITDLQSSLDIKYVKPDNGIPKTDLTSEIQSSLNKIDTNENVSAAISTAIENHNKSETTHNDIRALISGLNNQVNKFLDVDDDAKDQLSEVLEMIENNEGTIESLTSSKVSVSSIVDNLISTETDKPLSANQGSVLQSLINNLQISVNEELEKKVNKVDGKSLSTNDFTDTLLAKLNGIADGATAVNVDSSLSATSTNPVQNSVITSNINILANATNANAQSISEHTDIISGHTELIETLQTSINEISEISLEKIRSLFNKT